MCGSLNQSAVQRRLYPFLPIVILCATHESLLEWVKEEDSGETVNLKNAIKMDVVVMIVIILCEFSMLCEPSNFLTHNFSSSQ